MDCGLDTIAMFVGLCHSICLLGVGGSLAFHVTFMYAHANACTCNTCYLYFS